MLMTTHEMGDTQADDDAASEDGTQLEMEIMIS